MRNFLFVVLMIVSVKGAEAQSPKTDSLLRILNRSADDTNKVKLYWDIGVSIIYQNATEAMPYFKAGLQLGKKLQYDRGIEKCYAGTSLAYAFNAQYDSAMGYIDTAILYARKVGDERRLALVYLNRADLFQNLQNLGAALKNCDTALVFAERAGNKQGQARIFAIMSDIYESQERYALSFAYLEKSEVLFREIGNYQMIGMNYSDRADMYFLLKEYDKAVNFYRQAIHIADSVKDIQNLSAYYNGLAQVYVEQKRPEDATAAGKISLNYALQTGHRKQEANAHDIFYHVYLLQKNYPAAVREAEKTYAIFKEEKDLLREQISAKSLADVYALTGDMAKAYQYQKLSYELHDSLMKQQYSDETAQLETAFRVSQKDKEIELLGKDKLLQKQRLREQTALAIAAIIIAVLALAGIWLAINRNKLRQRMKELQLRNQIAADLHDEVGSSLSSIHMLSQMATQDGNETTHKAILQRMSSNAKETMDKMGDIVWMIKPGETEAGSLKQRMERFAYEICSCKNIEVALQLEELEKLKLSMEQRKNIYLIFKEAINNAVKYSGTQKIDVHTSLKEKDLILQVKDFGKGFDSSIVKKGNGLDNMRQRATDLHAALDVESAPGRGTCLKMTIPV